jgi:hypothetical protein
MSALLAVASLVAGHAFWAADVYAAGSGTAGTSWIRTASAPFTAADPLLAGMVNPTDPVTESAG